MVRYFIAVLSFGKRLILFLMWWAGSAPLASTCRGCEVRLCTGNERREELPGTFILVFDALSAKGGF